MLLSQSAYSSVWMAVAFWCVFSLSASCSQSKFYVEQQHHQGVNDFSHLSASPLKWAVVYDTRHVNMTYAYFEEILHRFINTTLDLDGKQLFANPPMLINSHGDVLTALTSITSMMLNSSNYTIPDVLFLMEIADVSKEVSNLFKKSNLTRNVVIISAFTSNTEVCDSTINPFTICVPPRDMINVRALLEVGVMKLNWHSIAMIYENSDYGRGVQSSVSDMLQQATNTPTVVHEAYINDETSTLEEDNLVKSILVTEPRAIVCFVNADELVRLRDAFARVASQTNKTNSEKVFLLGSKEAIKVLPNLTFASDTTAWWGALLLPNYTSVQEMQKLGIADAPPPPATTNTESGVEWDDYLAMTLSFLFDGMQMVAQAHGVTSLENLRSVHFTGFTGPVAFDPVYHQRIPCTFALVTQDYAISQPLLTWTMESYSSRPQINVLQAEIIDQHQLIPPSPLRSVTVCMTSPSSCADVQMLSAMLYQFLQHNTALSESNSGISVRPIAINTGDSGINGLSTLIPIARGCTFVTGPGRSSIALALTPVINEFQLTQIDYNSASDFFTSQPGSYPFFVRTTPSDSFKFAAYGEVCDHFAWERVIIISTRDQVGSSRAQSLATAMLHHNIHVEQMYVLDNASEAAIRSVLSTIYAKDVSRIIFVEIATASGNEADAFFNLSDKLTFMHNYVFFLSSDLCLHGYTSPPSRSKLQSSICIYSYVDPTVLQKFNTEIQEKPELYNSLQTVLSDGGFISQAQLCNLTQVPPFAGFAVDAGNVVIKAVSNAIHDNISLSTSSNLLQYTRHHRFSGLTGDFDIDLNGNRVDAGFSIDIQVPHKLLVIGTWNDLQTPKLHILYNSPFMWMTNNTDVPLDTFRDISFVISNTLTASPGAIVLSVLGFIGTITVFFFWYRHYKVQKMIELTLEGNEIPVTEEELQRLRGEYKYNDESE